jgi:hypothetical protein
MDKPNKKATTTSCFEFVNKQALSELNRSAFLKMYSDLQQCDDEWSAILSEFMQKA